VTEPETGPRTNDEADEARVKKWVGKVGGVTLPLLAGFSFTSVIVVSSDDAEHFLLTGLTILTLVVATLVLIVAVQCAYHAQIYFIKEDLDNTRAMNWYRWTRRWYDVGLFALFFGLGLAVAPPGGADDLRWSAASLAWLACLGEVVWILLDRWVRSVWTFGWMRSVWTWVRSV
jgi:hypothetical protein